MGNEYPLKMMVVGLKNLAEDNQALCDFLNIRARHKGFNDRFEGARHEPPLPAYRTKQALQERAAELVNRIADNNALAVISLGGEPATVSALNARTSEENIIRLMMDWGLIQGAVQKSMLRLYGLQPSPTPEFVSPGPATEVRLWSEAVAWLEKIAADTDLHTRVQNIIPAQARRKVAAPRGASALIRMEMGVHRVTLDLFEIAGRLPYHLEHAANPGGRTRGR